MNQSQSNGATDRPFLVEIRFNEGFDVCWASQNPFGRCFCFGSEDGKLLYTDENGQALDSPTEGSISEEAVNGVARLGQCLAVSTRQEVTFWTLPEKKGGKIFFSVFPHGAHGVTTTASGSIIAPLGRTGIMTSKPPFGDRPTVTVSSGEKEGLIFYRLVSLRSNVGEDLVGCAARAAGVATMAFRLGEEAHNLSTITFDGLDVVDICAIGTDENSQAVAAVGREGELILFHNILQDKKPLTLKYDMIRARLTDCSVVADTFLLTSEGAYLLAHLAKRFLANEPIGGAHTPISVMPMEAVDATICGDQWLLIVMPNGIRRYDLSVILDNIPQRILHGDIEEFVPRPITPMWKHEGITQHNKPVLAGVG